MTSDTPISYRELENSFFLFLNGHFDVVKHILNLIQYFKNYLNFSIRHSQYSHGNKIKVSSRIHFGCQILGNVLLSVFFNTVSLFQSKDEVSSLQYNILFYNN